VTQGDEYFGFLKAVRSARKRAAIKGLPFDVKPADARLLWDRCGGKCEVTGIPFDFELMAAKHSRRPYAPSLDRRDNALGYSVENVRVVCVAVNLAMNQWGEAVLLRIAAALFDTGAFARIGRQDTSPVLLPRDVRLYTGTQGIRYLARARDFGREDHLGTFDTIEQALEARRKWAKANSSLKVLRQIYEFTRDAELLNEINCLRE
jgi:hypothetical protein